MDINYYPNSIKMLIESFTRLPGIGEKTAERLAMHIIKKPEDEVKKLANNLITLKKKLRLCSSCYSFSDISLCNICTDISRNKKLLCIVEQPGDVISIEKSKSFNGLYHVLGGVISPIEGVGPDKIRIKELISRIKTDSIFEIIIATGTNFEGESTASYLTKILENSKKHITRIASGIPVGGDLKYLDQVTLKRALEGRYTIV